MKQVADPLKAVAAVIISYSPGTELFANVQAILEQVDKVILVNNGPESYAILKKVVELPGVEAIHNPENLGIATALNQGFNHAISCGFKYVLTFDQDSRPMPGMVEKLLDVYRTHARSQKVAVVGPSVEDLKADVRARHLRARGKLFFELASCETGWLEDVTFVITSGALCRVDVYQKIGGFRNDFFIDYVDMEYCLRAKKQGYEILVNCDAHLIHRLGNRQKRVVMGRVEYPRFHSPLRWYYVSRNRIPMLKMYAARFPYWFAYEIFNSIYGFVRMLLLEDQRLEKVRAFFRGTWDGLRGRLGSV
jgi:rhamnosyltransferase